MIGAYEALAVARCAFPRIREATDEARGWLLDVFGADDEAREAISMLNQIGVWHEIERHWDGGVYGYVQTIAA